MRKLTALGAAGVLAFALAACGSDSNDSPTDTSDTETTDTENPTVDTDDSAEDTEAGDADDGAAAGDLDRLALTDTDLPEGYSILDLGDTFDDIDDLKNFSGFAEIEAALGEIDVQPAACATNDSMNGLDLEDPNLTDIEVSTAVNETTGAALSVIAVDTEMDLSSMSDYLKECANVTVTLDAESGIPPVEMEYIEETAPEVAGASDAKSLTMSTKMDFGGQVQESAVTYHYITIDGLTLIIMGSGAGADTDVVLDNTLAKI